LSNNQPQPSQSTWAASGARGLAPSASMRSQQQQPSLSSQQQINAQQQAQQQHDDLFSSSSQLPNSQGGFRFGAQNAVGQSSQPNPIDEFPPLNRNANGEIGQDRGIRVIQNVMHQGPERGSMASFQNVGFGTQSNGLGFGSSNPPQPPRNNGLLNALSGSSRGHSANRVASPANMPSMYIPQEPLRDFTHQSCSPRKSPVTH
jgi:CCR4-NOT transcription complex subunit 2